MVSISSTVKERIPVSSAFFVKAKDTILGKKYDLDLTFIGEKRSKFLNSKFRKIKKPTDILSFEIEKNFGEIYITPSAARRKAKTFGKKYDHYLKFLFIHGLCHLKGMKHGSRMESQERRFRILLRA